MGKMTLIIYIAYFCSTVGTALAQETPAYSNEVTARRTTDTVGTAATTSQAKPATLVPLAALSSFCKPMKNYSLYEPWYVERVLRPFENLNYCLMPHLGSPTINGERNFIVFDTRTGLPVESSRDACNVMPQIAGLLFLSDYYEAFYGTPKLITASTSPPVLFNQIIFYCTPLCILTLVCSLHIIRRLLHENLSSHIFYYHCVVVLSDVLIYVVNALDSVNLFSLPLMPLCYTFHPVAAPAMLNYANDAALACVEALYCTSCMIQALMAFDRYCALYHPVRYHQLATRALAHKCLFILIGVNVVIGIVEFFSSNLMVRSLSRGLPGAVRNFLTNAEQARIFARVFLLNSGLAVQVFACTMVFIKMRQIQKQPKSTRSLGHVRSLASCYLLFGTCVLSLVGTAFLTVYLVLSSGPLVGTQISNKPLVAAQLIAAYGVKITTPICSGLGFYIHCVSSGPYRRLLMETSFGKVLTKYVFGKIHLAQSNNRVEQQSRHLPSVSSAVTTEFVALKETAAI